MTYLGTVSQQPHERLDYDLTYHKWLVEEDHLESFTTAIYSGTTLIGFYTNGVPEAPMTLDDGLILQGGYINDPRIKLFLEGGVDGQTYKIEVTATTRDGRVKQDEFKMKIKEI